MFWRVSGTITGTVISASSATPRPRVNARLSVVAEHDVEDIVFFGLPK